MGRSRKTAKHLWRPLALIVIVLLIPIIPGLAFGEDLESWIKNRLEQQDHPAASAALLIGLLVADIFVPVPASLVSTLGGAQLGWLGGTVASWIGLTVGALLGFYVARRWGRPVARYLARDEDLDRMQDAFADWGTALIVLCRGLPVVAEASVLLFGLNHYPWRRFLPAVLLSNLGIALAYSAFGDWAKERAWLPLALGLALAFPVLLGLLLQRYFWGDQDSDTGSAAGR